VLPFVFSSLSLSRLDIEPPAETVLPWFPDIGVCGGVHRGIVPGTPRLGTALIAGTRGFGSPAVGM